MQLRTDHQEWTSESSRVVYQVTVETRQGKCTETHIVGTYTSSELAISAYQQAVLDIISHLTVYDKETGKDLPLGRELVPEWIGKGEEQVLHLDSVPVQQSEYVKMHCNADCTEFVDVDVDGDSYDNVEVAVLAQDLDKTILLSESK